LPPSLTAGRSCLLRQFSFTPGFDMVESFRWLCAVGLGLALLGGCKSTAKHDNPVFGASPRRTSLDDAPDAKAIVDAKDLQADSEDGIQLTSSSRNDAANDDLFNATVVATANGAPIFAGEVLERYGDYLRSVRPKVSPEDYIKLRDEIIRRDLKSHIQKHLLVERTKGELKPEQVKALNAQLDKMFDKKVEQLKKELNVSTRTELERELNSRATSLNDVRNTFVSQGIAQGYLESRAERPKQINRQDLIDYYHEHSDEYKITAKVRWQQIQVTYAQAGSKAQATEKLHEAKAELDRGVPFVEVVAKYSDGPTVDAAGLRDWTQEGSLADEKLDKLLFSLSPDEEPAEYFGPQACQLVQVVEYTAAGVTPFTEVQEEIHQKLQRSTPTNIKDLIDKIYAEAVIETKYQIDEKNEG
jgi:outer membrane murein-binding lipoprotein Lpp